MSYRAMSFRLSTEMADEVAAVARTDLVSVSDAVRAAIATHISIRRADPDFQHRLKQPTRGLGAAALEQA